MAKDATNRSIEFCKVAKRDHEWARDKVAAFQTAAKQSASNHADGAKVLNAISAARESVLGGKCAPLEPMERGFADALFKAAGVKSLNELKLNIPNDQIAGFERALRFVLDIEKGHYSWGAKLGGSTVFGIASNSHKETYNNLSNLLGNENKAAKNLRTAVGVMAQFYYDEFWSQIKTKNGSGIEALDPTAQIVAFNAAVLRSPLKASRLVQEHDGDGPSMMVAEVRTLARLGKNPSYAGAFNGWMSRALELVTETLNPHKTEPDGSYRLKMKEVVAPPAPSPH